MVWMVYTTHKNDDEWMGDCLWNCYTNITRNAQEKTRHQDTLVAPIHRRAWIRQHPPLPVSRGIDFAASMAARSQALNEFRSLPKKLQVSISNFDQENALRWPFWSHWCPMATHILNHFDILLYPTQHPFRTLKPPASEDTMAMSKKWGRNPLFYGCCDSGNWG